MKKSISYCILIIFLFLFFLQVRFMKNYSETPLMESSFTNASSKLRILALIVGAHIVPIARNLDLYWQCIYCTMGFTRGPMNWTTEDFGSRFKKFVFSHNTSKSFLYITLSPISHFFFNQFHSCDVIFVYLKINRHLSCHLQASKAFQVFKRINAFTSFKKSK